MTLDEVFKMFDGGCQDPKCDHAHDAEEMFLCGKCHPDAPVNVTVQGRTMFIRCSVCERPVVKIEGSALS